MATYVPTPINRIPRTPLRYGRLLDNITELIIADGVVGAGEAWINGVTWEPELCLAPLYGNPVDACTRRDFTSNPRECAANITQLAFQLYDALVGAAIELTPEAIDEILTGRVNDKLSAAFASELIGKTSFAGASALTLRGQAKATGLGATATPLNGALRALENDLANRMDGAAGLIHMTPGMLGLAVQAYGVRLDGDTWKTPIGNTVIADAGYVGASAPVGFGAAPTTAQEYIYGTGAVQYKQSTPKMVDGGNLGSTITTYGSRQNEAPAPTFASRNRITRLRDVYGIVVFDPCPVVAVLASTAVDS